MNEVENTLSIISAFPAAGTVAGVIKICMGTVQTVAALACAIFFMLIPTITGLNDYSPIHYSWTHIQHGMANILAGVLEGIPILGTIMYVVRSFKEMEKMDVQVYVHINHRNKFMPYESLLQASIGGADEDLAKPAEERYGKALAEERKRNPVPISFARQLELAQAAIG